MWQPEVQADWSRGMVSDAVAEALPAGAVIDAADFLLHRPGVMQKRGGTDYAGPAMTAATYANTVAYVLYASGAQVLAVGDNGHLYTVAGSTTDVATLGSAFVSLHRPVIVPSSGAILTVFPANDGTTAPKKWDGAAAANLGGSPPTALTGAVYKQRLVLANSSANPNRIWFSPVPSVESTWDTSNSYIDAEQAVTGLAALNNTLLVFHRGSTERIVGATPPPNSDMDRALMWQVGCTDQRSILVQDGACIFANPRGVYLTNGSTPVSLTRQGGMDHYWWELMRGYDSATWSIACGGMRGFLFVTVMNGSTFKATLMCQLATRAWWRLTNIKAIAFASTQEGTDTLYYADRSTNRVVSCGNIFRPSGGVRNDADGTAVTPTVTLAPFGAQGPGVKHFGHGRVDYSMSGASSNPALTVTYSAEIVKLDGLLSGNSNPTEGGTMLETSGHSTRKRFLIGSSGQCLVVKIAQTIASDDTEIYAVEVEQRADSLTGDGTR